MTRPFAWSYSALTNFEQCPRKHNITRIEKTVTEPETEALTWGNRVHKALENRLKGGAPLTGSLRQFEPYAKAVLAQDGEVIAEQRLALSRDRDPVAFFSRTTPVWVRAVVDFVVDNGEDVFVGDWKTGKYKPDNDQLRLFAAVIFHHYPKAKRVKTGFFWLKGDGKPTTEIFLREDVAHIWQDFLPRAERMEKMIADKDFPARPSGLCRSWCPVGPNNCEHWESKK